MPATPSGFPCHTLFSSLPALTLTHLVLYGACVFLPFGCLNQRLATKPATRTSPCPSALFSHGMHACIACPQTTVACLPRPTQSVPSLRPPSALTAPSALWSRTSPPSQFSFQSSARRLLPVCNHRTVYPSHTPPLVFPMADTSPSEHYQQIFRCPTPYLAPIMPWVPLSCPMPCRTHDHLACDHHLECDSQQQH